MALFQGANDAYWFWLTLLVTVMMAVAIWFIVIIGRNGGYKQRAGESNRVPYGDLEEDHAPTSPFIIITIVGTALWGVGYLIWTGLSGLIGSR